MTGIAQLQLLEKLHGWLVGTIEQPLEHSPGWLANVVGKEVILKV